MDKDRAQFGLLLVYQCGKPLCHPLPLSSAEIEVGRGRGAAGKYADRRMSRRHVRVRRDGCCFLVEDLGSREGTFVDGERLETGRACLNPKVLRIGESVFLVCTDVNRPLPVGVRVDGALVQGAALQAAYQQAQRMAGFGSTLHITGESGVGKEHLARAAHAAAPCAAGPFVAVNCAAIPEGISERLLFGARRGAYSGAVSDSEGFVQAAGGGTLFLDEIGELPLSVQAKLLRVVESHEVLPLGANKAVPVRLQIYSATNRNLRTEVAHGRFREDLYFRLSRPLISLPPLRERREEIPWLIERALKGLGRDLTASVSLVERCLLGFWPGNVRELLSEVRTAGLHALAANRLCVDAADLCEDAGHRFDASPLSSSDSATPHGHVNGDQPSPLGGNAASSSNSPESSPSSVSPPTRELIEGTLRQQQGNITRTALALRLHRTQLKRFMLRLGLSSYFRPR